jgi:glycosyltransferase involved in cell wall biosynthesis
VADWRLRGSDRERFRSTVSRLAPDVLHVLFPDSVLQERFQLPLLTPRSIPLVTTWWNLAVGRRSPAALRLTSAGLLARSRVLTSHEPRVLEVLRSVPGRKPVEWLPVGNNLDSGGAVPSRAEARSGLGLDGTWLGYFGQLDETRGIEDLFAALSVLRQARDVRLLMIGSAGRQDRYRADPASAAYLDRALALPKQLGIGDAVRWTEYLPDGDVMLALRAVDLCVLPYRRNSIGRSALAAAFAAGAPTVLAGSAAGIAPLLAGRHVALVPPRDPARLAAALAGLLDDDSARETLEAGAAAAAELLSWPVIAEKASEIYALAAGR